MEAALIINGSDTAQGSSGLRAGVQENGHLQRGPSTNRHQQQQQDSPPQQQQPQQHLSSTQQLRQRMLAALLTLAGGAGAAALRGSGLYAGAIAAASVAAGVLLGLLFLGEENIRSFSFHPAAIST